MCENKKITVLGGVAIDTIATISTKATDNNNRGSIEKYIGGKGYNIAIALAVNYKNDDISFLSAVENNYHLPAIRNELKATGVKDLVMASDENITNMFMAIINPDGRSYTVTEEKLFKFNIPKERIDESLLNANALFVTGEISPTNFKYAIEQANTKEIKTFVLACSNVEAERLCLRDLNVDYLFGTTSNIDIIAKKYQKKSISELAEYLNAYIITFDDTSESININSYVNMPGIKLENDISIKRTNAIGYQDLFCASFLESILQNKSSEEAIKLGAIEVSNITSSRAVETATIKTEINKYLRNANIDSLTNVLNRRGFEHTIADVLKTSNKLFVAMLDIDHFKRINDTYGHQAGDDALSIFAKRIISILKESTSTFARCGGEEFCLVLECEKEDVENILNRVLNKISSRKFSISGVSKNIDVTVSIGYAEVTDKNNFSQAQKNADNALYKAKENGRNQIVSFNSLQ